MGIILSQADYQFLPASQFQHPISIPLDSLRDYITGQQGAVHVGDVNNALQALNVLFRHAPSLLFPSTRTSFFPMGQAGTSVRLPQGLQLWRGFFQYVHQLPFVRNETDGSFFSL